jgi:GH43 family beta-xylosidase
MLKTSFTNPIIPYSEKGNTSDPFVVRYNGAYYHCYSNREGVFIAKSDTLWELDKNPAVKVYDCKKEGALSHWYAPELHFINGAWYIYASPDYGGNAHTMTVLACQAEDPLGGAYEFKGQMQGLENIWSIDGTPFYYKDEWWFCWTDCSQVYLAKMNGPCGIENEKIVLTRPEYEFEKHGSPVNEGAAALMRNGKLFLVYSASDSRDDGYCLGLLEFLGDSAEEMLQKDKWYKHTSAVFKKTEYAFGPGHCSFTKVFSNGQDEDYIVYHANVQSGTGWNGRSVWVQKFTFDENGRPVFGTPQKNCVI